MEAKDTVMSRPMDLDGVYMGNEIAFTSLKELLKAQAEISFEAGIKEVVEFFMRHNQSIWGGFRAEIDALELLAKLKEWGIDG